MRGIKKRELVDMYRDDFQNILRSEIWWYFSRVDKTKNSESTAICFPTAEIS